MPLNCKSNEREVRGHSRTLASGRKTKVEPHCRKNRSKSRSPARKSPARRRAPYQGPTIECEPPKVAVRGHYRNNKYVEPRCRNPSPLYKARAEVATLAKAAKVPAAVVERVFDIASKEAYERAVKQANRDAAFAARAAAEDAARREIKETVEAKQAQAEKQAYAAAAKEAAAAGDTDAAAKLAEEARRMKAEQERHQQKAQQAHAQKEAEAAKAKDMYSEQQEQFRKAEEELRRAAQARKDFEAAARAAMGADKARAEAEERARAQAAHEARMKDMAAQLSTIEKWASKYASFGPHSEGALFEPTTEKWLKFNAAQQAPTFVFEEDVECNDLDKLREPVCLQRFAAKLPADMHEGYGCNIMNALNKRNKAEDQFETFYARQQAITPKQKKAYIRAMRATHPDKLAAANLSEADRLKIESFASSLGDIGKVDKFTNFTAACTPY